MTAWAAGRRGNVITYNSVGRLCFYVIVFFLQNINVLKYLY